MMSKGNDPIDYERVPQDVPATFPWIVVIKLATVLIAIPITLAAIWLFVSLCYWLKYGSWLGWKPPLGQ